MQGHSLVKVAAFFGVRKVLEVDELESFILLSEREYAEAIVFERGSIGGSAQGCPLCRSGALRSETMRKVYVRGRTWTTTFPGDSITS